jgi:hypothetical protein
MSLARIANFERFFDRVAPAVLLALGLGVAVATASLGI